MTLCAMNHPVGSAPGCPLCDPSAPIPPIPGRKAKAAARKAAPVVKALAAAKVAQSAQLYPCVDCKLHFRLTGGLLSISSGVFTCRGCHDSRENAARVDRAKRAALAAASAVLVSQVTVPVPPPLPAYVVKPARFPSKCPKCGAPIAPGQNIRVSSVRGVVSVHDACPAPVAAVAPLPAAVPPPLPKSKPAPVVTFNRPEWRDRVIAASSDGSEARTVLEMPAVVAVETLAATGQIGASIQVGDWAALFVAVRNGKLSEAEAVQIGQTWQSGARA